MNFRYNICRTVFFFLLIIYIPVHAQLTGFTLTGDPTALNGATWTYQDSVNGIFYDMAGILMAPDTVGQLPAVILSHGQGGSAFTGYPPGMGKKFVEWGYVVIAANLCHAGASIPIGAPGTNAGVYFGASEANVLRNMKCWEILDALNYVDSNCIAASGNSMGSFTSLATVAAHTEKFSCANHTGGGISLTGAFAAPTDSHAVLIQTPYIFHHGDSDQTYPISMDSAFNHILDSTGCLHQFYVYPGYNHGPVTMDSATLARTRAWFDVHKCRPVVTAANYENLNNSILYPNPATEYIQMTKGTNGPLMIYDIHGKMVKSVQIFANHATISISDMHNGIYIYTTDSGKTKHKFVIAR